MDLITVFIVGVVANLIAAYIYDSIRGRDSDTPPIILTSPRLRQAPTRPRERSINQRAINRERLNRAILSVILLVVRFAMLGMAIYLPVFLGQGLSDTLDLSVGNITRLLSSSDVPKSDLYGPLAIVLAVVFLPLLMVGDRILGFVRDIYDKFYVVDFMALLRLRFWVFFGVSILLAGLVTFAVTDLSILWALLAPIIFVIVLLALAQN